jgi:hypothetical protein
LIRDLDVLTSLVNVNTIETAEISLRLEVHYLSNRINQALRNGQVGASDCGAVNLSAHKDDLPVDRTSVKTSLVCDVHDIKIVVDLVDVIFPQCTDFGVSLQGLEHW